MENKLIMDSIDFLSSLNSYNEASIKRLQKLKERMIQFGFDSPFKPFLSMPSFLSSLNDQELSEEEAQDIRKHLSYFRYRAFLKKSLLRQVQLSIAAHKLYRALKSNGMTDLLAYIPLRGNHVDLIIRYGLDSLFAYKHLSDLLAKHADEKIFYKVKIKTNKGIEEKKVQTLEGLKGIVSSRRVARSRKIISSTSVSICYITAVATYACSTLDHEEEASELLKSYNQTLKSHGILPFVLMDRVEGFEQVKEDLLKKGFMVESNGALAVIPELEAELLEARRRRIAKLNQIAMLLFLTPLLRFYLLKSSKQRQSNPFVPSLEPNPSSSQISIFSALADKELSLKGIEKALAEKFKYERAVDNQTILSAALLKEHTSVSTKWVADFFSIAPEEVEDACSWYSSLRGGRGERFLKEL